jgi:hypothetical protein
MLTFLRSSGYVPAHDGPRVVGVDVVGRRHPFGIDAVPDALWAWEPGATIACMSQPVQLPDDIVAAAQRTAELAGKSIADQIAFWVQLGRVVEPYLDGARAGAGRPLSECLAGVDSEPGRQRVRDYLKSRPFPHYEPVPGTPGLLTRIDADGIRTLGRFVGRTFQAAE